MVFKYWASEARSPAVSVIYCYQYQGLFSDPSWPFYDSHYLCVYFHHILRHLCYTIPTFRFLKPAGWGPSPQVLGSVSVYL